MPDQNNVKPKIEEIASEYLSGEALRNLLDFAAWMRANKMTPTFANKSKKGVNYTSRVCYLKLRRNSWYIWPAGRQKEYANAFLACEELKELVSASLAPCLEGCSHQCNAGSGCIVMVCGKRFEHKCGCCPVRFHNPDAEALKTIKQIIEIRSNSK